MQQPSSLLKQLKGTWRSITASWKINMIELYVWTEIKKNTTQKFELRFFYDSVPRSLKKFNSICEKFLTSLINIFSQLGHCFMGSIKLFRTDCRSQTTPNCIQSMLVVWWCQLNEFSKPEIRGDVILTRKIRSGIGNTYHSKHSS